MKKAVILLVFTFSIIKSYSQMENIYLWPNAVPGDSVAKQDAVIKKDTAKKIIRINEVTNPLLKYYPAKGKNITNAAIIICPGGGYKFLAFDLEGEEIADWLSNMGIHAFVLQYRVPNNQKGALQDAQRAVRLVRSMSVKIKVDTNKIGIMGFSAGGNLAARTSTNYNDQTYTAVDKKDSLSCKPNYSLYIYPGSLAKGDDHKLIPELKVDKHTPPAFLFVANDDQYSVPLSFAYALHDAKVPMEIHVVPKGGHGYGLRKGNPAAEVWPALAEKWLQEYIH